jgi:cellulose synthase/poly-beta-1,6-N-acetylglucosamine synthase-like glycosyltransferase
VRRLSCDPTRMLAGSCWPPHGQPAPNTDLPSRRALPAPALSLILPCFNEAERLPRTLAGFLSELPQGPGEIEVLVVDDGSTDDALAVASAVAAKDARVRVIGSRPNRGQGVWSAHGRAGSPG